MIDLPPFLKQPRRRWRRADKVVRLIVGHWALGMALGAVLALVWLGLDVGGLRSLMWRSDVAATATFVFVAMFALTFGGVVAAAAAMRAGKDDDEPRGGRRAPAFAAARGARR